MIIYQTRSFAKQVNRLHNHEKDALDGAIRLIVQNPWIGEEKKGDLRGVFVHKFKIKSQQYLLAYQKTGPDIELIFMGSHQNFYRDLKHQMKNWVIVESSW